MSNILVTPAELQQAGAQFNAGAQEIEQILARLQALAGQLQWRGAAQVRFAALFAEWQQGAANIQHALTGIGQMTGQAGASFDEADQSIAASFR